MRPTLKLAFPIMAGFLGHMLIGLADTVMIGRVGVVPLAAAAFVNAVTHVPMVFGIGLLSSVAVLASQACGARQPREAGEVLRHGLLMALGMGGMTLLSLVGLWLALPWFGQTPEVVAASGTYLFLFGGSMVPLLIAHAGKQFSEALNHPWPPMFILLGSVGLNIWLNWILIYGNWGAPALGLEGAGWATLLARGALMVGTLAYVLAAPALREWQPVRWRAALAWPRLRRLCGLGWPVAGQHFMEVSAFVFAALMMGWISADAMAAHQIAISCAATSFMLALGIGTAVCIRVGQAWGANQPARLRRIGFVGLGMGVLIMGMFAVVFMTCGEPIARLFVSVPEVVSLAAHLLFIAAFFQIADGLQVVAISALRGLMDVRVPALVAVLAYWLLAVPLGYALAFHTGAGPGGIWIGLATGLGAVALTLSWRFHSRSRCVPRLPGQA